MSLPGSTSRLELTRWKTRWVLLLWTCSSLGLQVSRLHQRVRPLHLSTARLTLHSKRIFILGPSHHVYLTTCALSSCDTYETPLGPLTLDKSTISDLTQTKKFSRMNLSVDEEEHSIEMHLPYVYKAIQRARPGETIPIVPILVGSINRRQEKEYGEVLRPYLEDPENLFVVSSDFCHW